MISIGENLSDAAQESKSDLAPVRTLSAGRPAGPVIRGGREATERSVKIAHLPPLAVTARNGHPLRRRVQVVNLCMPAPPAGFELHQLQFVHQIHSPPQEFSAFRPFGESNTGRQGI